MADDSELAIARHIATNASNQLMLKMLFEMLISMSDNPTGLRQSLIKQLSDLADAMPLMPMPAENEAAVRGATKEICSAVLTNNPPS